MLTRTTGYFPAAECRAPIKAPRPDHILSENQRFTQTTGHMPPMMCWAPVKPPRSLSDENEYYAPRKAARYDNCTPVLQPVLQRVLRVPSEAELAAMISEAEQHAAFDADIDAALVQYQKILGDGRE